MGGGDLKLFCGDGIVPGSGSTPCLPCFFSCILGLIMGAIQKRGKENKGPQIPSDLPLHWRFYAMLLYGDGLVNWYMGLL